jgi:hypothetical protein
MKRLLFLHIVKTYQRKIVYPINGEIVLLAFKLQEYFVCIIIFFVLYELSIT